MGKCIYEVKDFFLKDCMVYAFQEYNITANSLVLD